MRLVAAAVLLLAVAPSAAWGLPIRVALVESARAVELSGSAIQIAPIGGCARCPARGWHAEHVHAVAAVGPTIDIAGRRASGFRLRSEAPIRLNGHEYEPPVELLRNGDGIAVVNEVPLEEYVVGVVRAEVGERWPDAALRAQAIAARTYAAYERLLNGARPYHLAASSAYQEFAGRVARSSPVWAAVEETTGQVLRFAGELFPAFYHAESGGYTEDPRLIFAARGMPPLVAVRDDFSAGSPHFYWSLDLRLSELTDILRRNGVLVGTVTGIDVTERTPSLRAVTVTVRGTAGSVPLRGVDFRRMVGYERLRSTLFAVALDGVMARFSGRGWGHGVGMSQWGARGMAERGYTAAQILAFYYPGSMIGSLTEAAAR